MSGSSSEEKNLPASARKLANERRKGHIAKAPDLQAGVVTIIMICWLAIRHHAIAAHMIMLFDAADHSVLMDFTSARAVFSKIIYTLFLQDALAPLALSVISSILIKLITNGGFIFSLDPIIPKPETINPVSGLKNIFKKRTFIDLGMSVLKTIFFGGTLALIILSSLNGLMRVPEAGASGLPGILFMLLTPLCAAACIFYLIAGVTDLIIQRYLFMQEMRMTKTETKNEHKETQGNPLIRKQQRRAQILARRKPEHMGPRRATVMLCNHSSAIGLRYNPPDTPLPKIVCRGNGEQAEIYRQTARDSRIPLVWEAELARDLAENFKPGMTITPAYFQPVARILQNLPT